MTTPQPYSPEFIVATAKAAAIQAVREAAIPTFRPATSVGGDPGRSECTVILDGDDTELTFPCLCPIPPVGGRVIVALTPPSSGFIAHLINGNDAMPVGSIVPYAGGAAPAGGAWLLCDGTAWPRAQYPALFGVIGTAFGSTATTFNVPDLRGRTMVHIDDGAGRLTAPLGVVGATAGSQFAQTGAHTHTLDVRFNVNNNHVHSGGIGGLAEGANPSGGPATPQTTGATAAAAGNSNLQPTMAVLFIIKA